ncbi:MAG: SpoIIE family protein phosphatase, partial [Thermoanaerobaculia bacterium]
AGQLYPYRVEPAGRVSALENPARPLGVALPANFRTVSAPFAVGDLWVFLSDGVIEGHSADGAEFGFERLERVMASAVAGRSAAQLRDEILKAWREFTGRDEPEDDLTLLVLRVLE